MMQIGLLPLVQAAWLYLSRYLKDSATYMKDWLANKAVLVLIESLRRPQIWWKMQTPSLIHVSSRKCSNRFPHLMEKFGVCPCFMSFLQAIPLLLSSSTILRNIFLFFFPDSCFFPWGLACCLFTLMHMTGVGNGNEGWLHANESTPLAPCITCSSSSKWLMEWLEGRFAWLGETILCCYQDWGRAAGKHPPIFTSLCSASNTYSVPLASV